MAAASQEAVVVRALWSEHLVVDQTLVKFLLSGVLIGLLIPGHSVLEPIPAVAGLSYTWPFRNKSRARDNRRQSKVRKRNGRRGQRVPSEGGAQQCQFPPGTRHPVAECHEFQACASSKVSVYVCSAQAGLVCLGNIPKSRWAAPH